MPHRIEYYLPLFFEQHATLFDYLPQKTLVALAADSQKQLEHFWLELSGRYEERRHDNYLPILPPDKLFLRQNELFAAVNNFARLTLNQQPVPKQA